MVQDVPDHEACCQGGRRPREIRDLCVSSSLLGPVDPSFRALSGRLKFTARRHKFNKATGFRPRNRLSSQRGVTTALTPGVVQDVLAP